MTEGQAGSRITVEQSGGSPGPWRGPNPWLLPLVGILILGTLWSFRGEATPEEVRPLDLDSIELVTTTTGPPLNGDLSVGWAAIDLPGTGEIVDIAATRFGLFAVGSGDDQVSLWRSETGLTWDLMVDEAELFSNAEVNAVLETEFGLVAVGAWTDVGLEARDQAGDLRDRRRPAVWLSGDGQTWERLPDDQIERSVAGSDADRPAGAMNDVVVWEDQLVAGGWSSSSEHHGAVWVADLEGRVWRPALSGLAGSGTTYTEVTGISGTERGLVAVGSTRSRPSVWVSADALTWSGVDASTALGTMQYDWPAQVTSGGVGLVAVGTHRRLYWGSGDDQQVPYSIVWLSRDAEEWLRLAPAELAGVTLVDLIAADPWLVAAGSRAAGFSNEPGIWYSTTGAEWQEIDLGLGEYGWGESEVNVIERGGPGLVAGGTVGGAPELWVWSPDGAVEVPATAWERPSPGRWVLQAEFDAGMWAIGLIPGGYGAFGQGEAWRSPDGIGWESVPIEEVGLPGDTWYSAPVTINGISYMVGDPGSVWSSRDGLTWKQVGGSFAGWLGELFRAGAVRPGADDEVLVVEYPRSETDENRQPQLWRLSDGEAWVEVPLPQLDWIAGIGVIEDRYLLAGWSGAGGHLWVSNENGAWEMVELDRTLDFAGQMVTVGERMLLPVVEGHEAPVTRILSTKDGLSWGIAEAEVSGWVDQIVPVAAGAAMVVNSDMFSDDGIFRQTIWTSPDGIHWAELGPVPRYGDSWAHVVPGAASLTVVIEYAERASLWEWVPPAG